MGRFKDSLYCGINKADKTVQRLFDFNHEIKQAESITFTALNDAVKLHAQSKNIDLGADKYKPYIVTNEQVDIAKVGAATAKWRVVVKEPGSFLSFEKGCDENLNDKNRLVHIFYGEVGHSVADLSNVEGGSAATIVSKFLTMCDNIANVLQLKFNDSKGSLPSFVSKFFFPSSIKMKQVIKEAADEVVRGGALSTMSTGNLQICLLNSDLR